MTVNDMRWKGHKTLINFFCYLSINFIVSFSRQLLYGFKSCVLCIVDFLKMKTNIVLIIDLISVSGRYICGQKPLHSGGMTLFGKYSSGYNEEEGIAQG